MQVEFRSHFSGKKCVLWAGEYGIFFFQNNNFKFYRHFRGLSPFTPFENQYTYLMMAEMDSQNM